MDPRDPREGLGEETPLLIIITKSRLRFVNAIVETKSFNINELSNNDGLHRPRDRHSTGRNPRSCFEAGPRQAGAQGDLKNAAAAPRWLRLRAILASTRLISVFISSI